MKVLYRGTLCYIIYGIGSALAIFVNTKLAVGLLAWLLLCVAQNVGRLGEKGLQNIGKESDKINLTLYSVKHLRDKTFAVLCSFVELPNLMFS